LLAADLDSNGGLLRALCRTKRAVDPEGQLSR